MPTGGGAQPPLLKRNHAEERLGVTIDDVPLMIADVFPCNKIFRLDFWRRQGLAFPVDVRYEDQVLCTQAFLRRDDVRRPDRRRLRVEHARRPRRRRRRREVATRSICADRMVTKQMTVDLVRGHGNPDAVWTRSTARCFRSTCGSTSAPRWRPPRSDPDRYWATLRAGQLKIWNDDTVPFECTAVPAGQRLMGWLVGQDRRDDLARLVAQIDGPGVPVEEGRYLHPWVDEPGVPAVLSSVRTPSA